MPAAPEKTKGKDADAEMAPVTQTLIERLEAADASTDDAFRESEYRAIIASDVSTESDVLRAKEGSIISLAKLLVKVKRSPEVIALSKEIRPFYSSIPKAKTAKIVRSLLDIISAEDISIDVQRDLCMDTIAWCKESKRTFLRQRIEGKLASLYLLSKKYEESLKVINNLLREVKRLDDKAHLLEIQLIESRIYHSLRNIPKARAALTSARTTANAIYVPPSLQSEIDMQAGIIAAEEKDYKTAYSYFYEGFEGFQNLSLDAKAIVNLKYMLLCKIMSGKPVDVDSIVSGNIALKYSGIEVDAMKAVAQAYSDRSLENFEKTLQDYKPQLTDDPIVHAHLDALYNTLKEQNLLRLIEPFSRVEIQHVAKLIKLDVDVVESKLSQMILDKKLNGILDQGAGCLVVFDDLPLSKTYQTSLDTLFNMGNVVDSLFDKAAVLR